MKNNCTFELSEANKQPIKNDKIMKNSINILLLLLIVLVNYAIVFDSVNTVSFFCGTYLMILSVISLLILNKKQSI